MVMGTARLSMRLLHGHQPQAILHELVKNSKLVLPGAATVVGGTVSPSSSMQVVGVTDGAVGLAIVPDSVPVLPEAFCVRSVSSLRGLVVSLVIWFPRAGLVCSWELSSVVSTPTNTWNDVVLGLSCAGPTTSSKC